MRLHIEPITLVFFSLLDQLQLMLSCREPISLETFTKSSAKASSLFSKPVELFVWEYHNSAAWKTYEQRLRSIHMLISRKSGFTHRSMTKTSQIMAGIL